MSLPALDPALTATGMISARTRGRLIDTLRRQGIKNAKVLEVMAELPRHLFVEHAIRDRAYENIALPIGQGQTISQPYTVARMTEILLQGLRQVGGQVDKVLEIGCGCGYQAALLSYFFKEVYAIERIASLLKRARKNLQSLGRSNVYTAHGDGHLGWPSAISVDGILVSAATDAFPSALSEQLGARSAVILPFGGRSCQQIRLITYSDSERKTYNYEDVIFVPLLEGTKQ